MVTSAETPTANGDTAGGTPQATDPAPAATTAAPAAAAIAADAAGISGGWSAYVEQQGADRAQATAARAAAGARQLPQLQLPRRLPSFGQPEEGSAFQAFQPAAVEIGAAVETGAATAVETPAASAAGRRAGGMRAPADAAAAAAAAAPAAEPLADAAAAAAELLHLPASVAWAPMHESSLALRPLQPPLPRLANALPPIRVRLSGGTA